MQNIKVEVQKDHLEKISGAPPRLALAEFIWNALDADATKIEVRTENDPQNTISPLRAIWINDNGNGLPLDEAIENFKKLGGSWKKFTDKTKNGRFLHGKEGKGRFKAFSLGRVVEWQVAYKNNGEVRTYAIEAIEDSRDTFRFSDEDVSSSKQVGVKVRISELKKQFRFLEDDGSEQAFAEIFSTYLTLYKNIKIIIEGKEIDPSKFIDSRTSYELKEIIDQEGNSHKVSLEIIEWNTKSERNLYLCDEQGFPLRSKPLRINPGNFQFSAYLKSSYIGKLNYEGETLDLADMDDAFNGCHEEAVKQIREHFREKAAKLAESVVEVWKRDEIYPYTGEPESNIEAVERKVFDIVATNVNEFLPDFEGNSKESKGLHLRLLKNAIEKSPKDLQRVLNEFLNLPNEKVKELAELLDDISLSSLIEASKIISDRLKFLAGLEELIFSPETKKHVKERSQLHKLVEHNAWLFGEDFHMSATDKSLTEVLKKHAQAKGMEILIQDPVVRLDGKKGIIDLMFSKTNRSHKGDKIEHLIVELKAPKVKIGQEEINQIKNYAFAVAKDERFDHGKTEWEFWVISNEMDELAEMETSQAQRPKGVLYQNNEPNITIWAKKWSEVIEDNKSRMKFFKDNLNYDPDGKDALSSVKEKYSQYFAEVK